MGRQPLPNNADKNCYLSKIQYRLDFARNIIQPYFNTKESINNQRPRCAMVFGGVVSRDGLGLGRIGAPGYRAHSSVAMAPMFKGIRFGRHHFCSEV